MARDGASLSALQKLRFFPLAVTGGKGCTLIEEGGRELLDLSAAWGAASLGHSHPAIRSAVDRALANQAGASILSGTNEPAVDLAEMLLNMTLGKGDRRVWLGHSGSDANETVARVVPAATGWSRIMAFSGAYHGGTQGSMSVSGHTAQDGVAKAASLTLMPYPGVEHRSHKGLNNQAENSYLPFRKRERTMQGYRSPGNLRQVISIHSAIRNCFSVPARRHSALTIRYHRLETFDAWNDSQLNIWRDV